MFDSVGRFARSVWGLPTTIATTVTIFAALSGYHTTWQKPHQLPEADLVATQLGSSRAPIQEADLLAGAPLHLKLVPLNGEAIDYAGAELRWALVRDGEALRRWTTTTPELSFSASELSALDGRLAVSVSVWKNVRRTVRTHEIRVQTGYLQLALAGQTASTPTFADDPGQPLDLTQPATGSSVTRTAARGATAPAAAEDRVGLDDRLQATSK